MIFLRLGLLEISVFSQILLGSTLQVVIDLTPKIITTTKKTSDISSKNFS